LLTDVAPPTRRTRSFPRTPRPCARSRPRWCWRAGSPTRPAPARPSSPPRSCAAPAAGSGHGHGPPGHARTGQRQLRWGPRHQAGRAGGATAHRRRDPLPVVRRRHRRSRDPDPLAWPAGPLPGQLPRRGRGGAAERDRPATRRRG
jgi:hypothetical protein